MKVIKSTRKLMATGKAKKRKFSCPDAVELNRSEVRAAPQEVNPATKPSKDPMIRRKSMPSGLERTAESLEDLKPVPRAVSFQPEILLHSAIMDNNADELVKLLKTSFVDINQPNSYGRLPIHEAASEGHVECAQVLIENGAFLTAESYDGLSPLEAAVYGGNFECAELLIRSGAPIDKIKDGFLEDPVTVERQAGLTITKNCAERVYKKD